MELKANNSPFNANTLLPMPDPGFLLMEEGRVYGGGLYKLEPKELANVPADSVLRAFSDGGKFRMRRQMELFA